MSQVRRLLQKLIPGVIIVVDRCHVQQYANKAVDAVRKAVRAQMKSMCHRKLLRKRWNSLTRQEAKITGCVVQMLSRSAGRLLSEGESRRDPALIMLNYSTSQLRRMAQAANDLPRAGS